jgi:hypothetical protein
MIAPFSFANTKAKEGTRQLAGLFQFASQLARTTPTASLHAQFHIHLTAVLLKYKRTVQPRPCKVLHHVDPPYKRPGGKEATLRAPTLTTANTAQRPARAYSTARNGGV